MPKNRHSTGKRERATEHLRYPSSWGKWIWSDQYQRFYRCRYRSKDNLEYEYDNPQSLDSSNYDQSQTPDTYNYDESPSKSLVQGFAGLGLTTGYQPSIFGPIPSYPAESGEYPVATAAVQTPSPYSSPATTSYVSEPRYKYNRVRVHLIRRKDEGKLVCKDEVDLLCNTFWSNFRFKSTQFHIPSQNAGAETNTSIQNITANCQEGDLLILYYAGHGANANGFELRQDKDAARIAETVLWQPLQEMLKRTEADVLLLLDSCSSEAATRSQYSANKICIAACPADSETIGPGPYSYTSALIATLRTMTQEKFSANAIYNSISDIQAEHQRTVIEQSKRRYIFIPCMKQFAGKEDISLV